MQVSELIDYRHLAMYARIILIAIATLVGTWWLRRMLHLALSRAQAKTLAITLWTHILSTATIALGCVAIAQELGFHITPLLGAAGIAGIALGLAAQASISNLISGIFVSLEESFVLYDRIKINDVEGTVTGITLSSVQLTNSAGHYVRIPHEMVLKNVLINLSSAPFVKLMVPIVLDSTEYERVMSLLQKTTETTLHGIIHGTPQVVISTARAGYVVYQVTAHVVSNAYNNARTQLTHALYTACIAHKIPLAQSWYSVEENS